MSAAKPGTVYLVGAGPGDEGLLTLRAAELLASADVILHDQLIPVHALARARADAELIDVGKIGGGKQVPQELTEELIVEHALAGRSVVRLKGGDPFVFGRGGEEAITCIERGINVEVVPGVTSGIAAPAYAGIPVTQRSVAAAVAFVTGHENPNKPESQIDWSALASFPGTLVFYMGVKRLGQIAEKLITAGRPADQPVAVIERGTFASQREAVGTLETIAAIAEQQEIKAPAITVIGDVAALGNQMPWRQAARPLAGISVAVTRARAQASSLATELSALGAEVVEAPAIRIEPLSPSVPDLEQFDLLCITSPNGADQLFEAINDARDLAGMTIAAIGPGTARALLAHGIKADIVPERSIAEALVEALVDVPVERALIARAEEARDVLADALRERGAEVEILALYRTVAEPLDGESKAAALGADYATFTSASSARFFNDAAGTLEGPRLVSIGPVTSAQIRELGYEPAIEAEEHTPDGLVAALIADAAKR
ncbi:MAG: uroporphyrinogen-III C-methyltransferase [Actinobacteria bacterium]|uniref:uroporphyrinogen-III C-methyltransferase n=1 Tax=freshwater metagenome TaxID=449393 RepID=A0A6J5YUD3_9ZZZZ|nr:uroporphyrinogen-III C-methyltransferase [Actinomycetota bacterium]